MLVRGRALLVDAECPPTQATGRRILPRESAIPMIVSVSDEYTHSTSVDSRPHAHRLHRRVGRMVQIATLGPTVQHGSHA